MAEKTLLQRLRDRRQKNVLEMNPVLPDVERVKDEYDKAAEEGRENSREYGEPDKDKNLKEKIEDLEKEKKDRRQEKAEEKEKEEDAPEAAEQLEKEEVLQKEETPEHDGLEKAAEEKDAAGKETPEKGTEPPTRESALERIKLVEDEGLYRIENGLKNFNTDDLMQGLCQVIASRSARAHKDEVKPQDIERSLSPECIDRVRSHFGKKLEAALKDIDKDEFLTIMQSDDIGDKMAKTVGTNLNKHELQAVNEKQMAGEKVLNEVKKGAVLPRI